MLRQRYDVFALVQVLGLADHVTPIGTDQVDVFPAHLHQFAWADRQHDQQAHCGGNAAVVAVIQTQEKPA
ncbi:hypothetical protein D3C86_1793820 [compost metagenome]